MDQARPFGESDVKRLGGARFKRFRVIIRSVEDAKRAADACVWEQPDTPHTFALALDYEDEVLGFYTVKEGPLGAWSLAQIFRPALAAGASRVILCHLRPAGDLSLQPADREAIQKARAWGTDLGVPIDDVVMFCWAKADSVAESYPDLFL